MVKSMNILLNGAVLSSVVIGTVSTNEHQRLLQRQADLADKTPLSDEEKSSFNSLLKRGAVKLGKSVKGSPKKKSQSLQTRRALKAKKDGGFQGSAQKQSNKPPQRTGRAGGAPSRTSGRPAPKKGGAPKGKPAGGPQGHTQRAPPQRTGRHPQEDDTSYYDDYFAPHDDYYGKGSYYDDYYYDDYYYYYDDYYGKGTGKGYYDDYYYHDDYYGSPPGNGLISLTLEAFQDSRFLQFPVFTNSNFTGSEFDPGTVYLFNSENVLGVLVGEDGAPVPEPFIAEQIFVDESFQIGTVSGKCTRIDVEQPFSVDYEGRSICQFVYSFLNDAGDEEAQMTAEGLFSIGTVANLAITGGTGIFRRAVGEVLLYPVNVGPNSELQFSSFADLPTSWFMQAFTYLEESLVPPELFEMDM